MIDVTCQGEYRDLCPYMMEWDGEKEMFRCVSCMKVSDTLPDDFIEYRKDNV